MATENKKTFQFTIGPVQGFVSQARRTRDFWAGSFLLSWLSGVAMAEITRQGGEVKFPIPPDDYLKWITGEGKGDKPPRQGAIPNRFKAMQSKVPADFDGALVATCVREAWKALAKHVWEKDGLNQFADEKSPTAQIWGRQNAHFWEISWVITGDDEAVENASLMDERKNWRNHYAQPEPGVKCMVMDGWQELSGAECPGNTGKEFWKNLREKSQATGIKTDIAEGEQLCALAYIKRRFARHFESFEATLRCTKMQDKPLTLKGWKLDSGMPSTSYMAAVHWLENVAKTASADEAWRLLGAAKKVKPDQDEWDTRIACLDALVMKDDKIKRKLISLDASVFFEHVQNNAKVNGLEERAVPELIKKMNAFGAPPSPFYAILLMDGDSLGSHMSKKENQPVISHALNAFTSEAPEIVEKHNGMLIYAGGDDVLAILPLEDALKCAAAVRQCYLDSFAAQKTNTGIDIPTTISAAIEFAHVKMPLGKVLADAHSLLDDVAKDGAGRDAVAVRVWKTGRMTLEWAQPWEIALEEDKKDDKKDGEKKVRVVIVQRMADEFADVDKQLEKSGKISNKFFFKIRERFDLLNSAKNAKNDDEAVLSDKEAIELLAVDYVNSADNRKLVDMDGACKVITPLLKQCRRVTRLMKDGKVQDQSTWKVAHLTVGGALLVRFLAQKGAE